MRYAASFSYLNNVSPIKNWNSNPHPNVRAIIDHFGLMLSNNTTLCSTYIVQLRDCLHHFFTRFGRFLPTPVTRKWGQPLTCDPLTARLSHQGYHLRSGLHDEEPESKRPRREEVKSERLHLHGYTLHFRYTRTATTWEDLQSMTLVIHNKSPSNHFSFSSLLHTFTDNNLIGEWTA